MCGFCFVAEIKILGDSFEDREYIEFIISR